jgi:hypothetical protein
MRMIRNYIEFSAGSGDLCKIFNEISAGHGRVWLQDEDTGLGTTRAYLTTFVERLGRAGGVPGVAHALPGMPGVAAVFAQTRQHCCPGNPCAPSCHPGDMAARFEQVRTRYAGRLHGRACGAHQLLADTGTSLSTAAFNALYGPPTRAAPPYSSNLTDARYCRGQERRRESCTPIAAATRAALTRSAVFRC